MYAQRYDTGHGVRSRHALSGGGHVVQCKCGTNLAGRTERAAENNFKRHLRAEAPTEWAGLHHRRQR